MQKKKKKSDAQQNDLENAKYQGWTLPIFFEGKAKVISTPK